MKHFYKIFFGATILVALVGCQQQESGTSLSNIARITSFAFTPNDSFPGMAAAKFIVEELNDTGIIRMRKNDSVAFGTPINKIVPAISYYAPPAAVVFYFGDSIAIPLTGYDTLDLSIRPIKVRVISQDTKNEKWYNLDFSVHTMNGDLFLWDTLTTAISPQKVGEQKALNMNGIFYFYQNNGFRPRMFMSRDKGETWTERTITGLPANCTVRQITEGPSQFFYAQDNKLYLSDNGYEWKEAATLDIQVMAIYMCFNEYIWFSGRDSEGKARLYTIGEDLTPVIQTNIGLPGDTLPLNFPVQDFASIPFTSSSLHLHNLIAGGYDRRGEITNALWSLEYNYIYDTYHITDMASESKFPPFAGASISYYGKFLYLIGGIHDDRSFIEDVYVSTNEGMHWTQVQDTLNPMKPGAFVRRYRATTFVDSTNLYIIGGEDFTTGYSDVYRGKMNSIGWPEIGN